MHSFFVNISFYKKGRFFLSLKIIPKKVLICDPMFDFWLLVIQLLTSCFDASCCCKNAIFHGVERGARRGTISIQVGLG